MPFNYAMKSNAQIGKNKGSSVLRFLEVDSLGVPLLPTAVDVFGNKGGVVYEAPWLKTSKDADNSDRNEISDETGVARQASFGDRKRMFSGEFLGNYEELCYDAKGATIALSTPFAQKAAGVVTLTTASAHGYVAGDYVNVFGAGAATATALSFNGLHKVVSVPTSTTLTYNFGTDTPADLTSGTVGDAACTLASCTRTLGVVTITTAAAHNRVVGQMVRIVATGTNSASYNGIHTITSVPSATTYTYSYGTTTVAAPGTAITQHTAFYLNIEDLLVSGSQGRQFKAWYFSPVKTGLLSTDVVYSKYIYWMGQFAHKYEDGRSATDNRSLAFEFNPYALDTAIVDKTGGQIFAKIRVPSIPAATAVDLMELQVQSSTN